MLSAASAGVASVSEGVGSSHCCFAHVPVCLISDQTGIAATLTVCPEWPDRRRNWDPMLLESLLESQGKCEGFSRNVIHTCVSIRPSLRLDWIGLSFCTCVSICPSLRLDWIGLSFYTCVCPSVCLSDWMLGQFSWIRRNFDYFKFRMVMEIFEFVNQLWSLSVN